MARTRLNEVENNKPKTLVKDTSKSVLQLEKEIAKLKTQNTRLKAELAAAKDGRVVKFEDPRTVKDCKPCPKCESKNIAINNVGSNNNVYCRECGEAGPVSPSKKMAMINWNLM